MKKLFYFIIAAVFAAGCSEAYDDSALTGRVDNLEDRVSKLEILCSQMNTNISSLQTLVNALSQNDYITNVAPISRNGEEVGYTITFKSGKTITIYHGKDGKDGTDGKDGINGTNGADGKDGKDGLTPIIGVKLFNGVYYWTLNGEWLLDDDGNKIKAVGTDGKDGQNGADGKDGEDGKDGQDGATGPQGPQGPAGENGADGEDGKDGQNGADGKDGITPQLKIEEGYWYISYDNGASWKQLGKATGEDGKDGENGTNGTNGADGKDGDSFFQSVTQDDEYVYFTLADGTQITLAKEQALEITFNTEECFVNGGESYEVTYTITGADADTKVAAMAQDNYTVKVVPTDYKSGKIVVTAPSADITESQVLVFVSKGTQTIMRVLYFAEKVTLTVSTDNVALEYDDTTFEVKVTTNLDYTVHIPEEASSWLSVASTRAMREETLLFAVEENTTAERRSTIVELRNNGKTVQSIAVSQDVNPEYLPANNKIFYTSANGKSIHNPTALGAAIVSNTYANGVGVIVCDRDITMIGKNAFSTAQYLTSIIIPCSVTEIGDSAFYRCSSLTSITIPDNVIKIGKGAFEDCSSLISIAIPDSVTSIGEYAFHGCSSLTSITIPDNVTKIEDYTFHYCKSLTSVTIPDSITAIGVNSFSFCHNLTCVTIPNSVTAIGNYAFRACKSLANIAIPNSVLELGNEVFALCSNLTNIIIPDGVTTIGYKAFYSCTSLTSVTIGNSVKKIGGSAFKGCSGLTNIIISDSVTEIENGAFSGCSSLTKAVIGSGVKKIEYSAFENCYFLNEIICKPTTPPTAYLDSGVWNAFNTIGTSPNIYVPMESVDAYKTADGWKDYADIIVGYDFNE